MTFWEKRDTDPRFTGPPPSKRIEQLRDTAGRIPSMTPAQQQTLAGELAEGYRNEADPLLRVELVRTIAKCGSPQAGETLQAAMRDSDGNVRVAACTGWAQHRGPQAVPALGEAIRKDADLEVRLAALRALGRIPGEESVAAISPALEDSDPAMQYRAVQALRELTGKDFGDDANAWREYARGGNPKEISLVQRTKLDVF